MIYLATPYMHKYAIVRQQRYHQAMKLQAFLIKSGYKIYSPIVMCHQLSVKYGLPKDEKFWKDFDESFIDNCDEIWFALISGWKKSNGMKREYIYAKTNNKLIKFIGPTIKNSKQKITDLNQIWIPQPDHNLNFEV